jgi:hypothetical protein
MQINPKRLVLAASGLLVASTAASGAELVAGSAEATVSDFDGNLTVFRVDGGEDNVFLANFFFRTDTLDSGNGGEVKLNALGPVTVTTPTANRVVLTSAGQGLSARQEVTLTGGPVGSGTATLFTTFALTNTGSEPVDLELFYAADFDLNFDQGNPDDRATLLDQTSVLIQDDLSDLVVQAAPTSDSYQLFDGTFDVLFKFNANTDGATTLNNTPGIGGTVFDEPGITDGGLAFGWSRTLQPGDTFSTFAVNNYTVIPEPASLLGLAAAGLLRRRR